MARSRHKSSKRGRQPGQRPQRPADPIVAAAAIEVVKNKPSDDSLILQAHEPAACYASSSPSDQELQQEAEARTPLRGARGMSLLALSHALRVDRSVVLGWVQRDGCPTLEDSRGKGTGNEWRIDLADVVAWLVQHERKKALSEAGIGVDMDIGDRIKLLKLAQQAKLVAPIAFFEARNRQINVEFRQTIMSIGDRVGRTMDGLPKHKVDAWGSRIGDLHREALDRMQGQRAAMFGAAPEDSGDGADAAPLS